MLQWYSNAQGWNHRAYWGVDFLCSPMMWGCGGESPANHYMGVLPGTGWQKLVVPASSVGLEGQTVNGVAFSLYGGRATWDSAGKISVGGGSSVRSSFGFSLNSANNPTNACAIVLIYKNPDASTKIYSYGYNNCNSSDSRRVERGIEVQY
jgi:hypothetical protein